MEKSNNSSGFEEYVLFLWTTKFRA